MKPKIRVNLPNVAFTVSVVALAIALYTFQIQQSRAAATLEVATTMIQQQADVRLQASSDLVCRLVLNEKDPRPFIHIAADQGFTCANGKAVAIANRPDEPA